MSLSDVISKELADALSGLSVSDFQALARAGSLGLSPSALRAGVQAIERGDEAPLPPGGGQPRPLVIQAWSFVKDKGQYHDTYGLSSAKAGELTDLLFSDREKGLAEITSIVTAALRQRGSKRPIRVTAAGLPGASDVEGAAPAAGGSDRLALKDEIRRDPATYGLYQFLAEDTGRSGGERFRVGLGGGLYACHQSKVGAVDVARICRKHGRDFPLIHDHIVFWMEGMNPVRGDAIPSRITYSGVLPPNGEPPADPVARAKTSSPDA